MTRKSLKRISCILTILTSLVGCNAGAHHDTFSSVSIRNTSQSVKNKNLKYGTEILQIITTINKAIWFSPSAISTILENNSSLNKEDIAYVDHYIEHNYSDPNAINALINQYATIGAEDKSNLIQYIHSQEAMILSASPDNTIYLKNLINNQVGVCDNLTALAFILLTQNPDFKNVKMVPLSIGDHVALLLRFPDVNQDYVLDAWLPYLYTNPGLPVNSEKAFYGTAEDYFKKLKSADVPDNIYFDKAQIKPTEFAAAAAKNMNEITEDEETYFEIWRNKRVDPADSVSLKDIADTLIHKIQGK